MSKASALATRVQTLERKRDDLTQAILDAQHDEEVALYAAVAAAPAKSTGAVGSPEQRARKKRAESERALERLEVDLRVTRQLLDEASAQETEEAVSSLCKHAKTWDRQESDVWRRAGDSLAHLSQLWDELQKVVSERAEYFNSQSTALGSVDAQQRGRDLGTPYISPTPPDRERFVAQVLDALDGHGRPVVPTLDPGEVEPGWKAPKPQPVIAQHLDDHDRLWKLIDPLTERKEEAENV